VMSSVTGRGRTRGSDRCSRASSPSGRASPRVELVQFPEICGGARASAGEQLPVVASRSRSCGRERAACRRTCQLDESKRIRSSGGAAASSCSGSSHVVVTCARSRSRASRAASRSCCELPGGGRRSASAAHPDVVHERGNPSSPGRYHRDREPTGARWSKSGGACAARRAPMRLLSLVHQVAPT